MHFDTPWWMTFFAGFLLGALAYSETIRRELANALHHKGKKRKHGKGVI